MTIGKTDRFEIVSKCGKGIQIVMRRTTNNSLPYAGDVTAIIASLSLVTILFAPIAGYGQAVDNVAPLATVDGPGKEPRAAVDGVKQQDGTGEWIGGSPNLWFGWIHYPKNLELKWKTPRQINKVIIYDRPTLKEHMGACTPGWRRLQLQ